MAVLQEAAWQVKYLIINPLAGTGEKFALKGADGEDVLNTALACGTKPEAQGKAERAL